MNTNRNKTLTLSDTERATLIKNCITLSEKSSALNVINKTVLGDTFNTLPYLPDKFVDLLIADPPYNIYKDYGGNVFKKSSDEDYEIYTENWVKAVIHTLKDDASIYVCCDYTSSGAIERVLKKYFKVRNRITWQREKGRGATANWKNGMEDIWFATLSDKYTFNVDAVKIRRKVLAPYKENGAPKDWVDSENGKYRDTYPSNFWDDISIPFWSMPENTPHPTQKPEKLLAKLILASSDIGDTVLDIFGGSGSTAVTAKKLGRKYLSIEQNPEYCAYTEKRLIKAETDKKIQGYENGVFYERNTTIKR